MRAIILAALLILATSPAFATNLEIFDETELGAKIDAPNLFVKKGNHSLGAEISITDMFNSWDDGSQAFVKYTWTGSIFDLDK